MANSLHVQRGIFSATSAMQKAFVSAKKLQLAGTPWFYFSATLLCVVLESIPSFDRSIQSVLFQHGSWLISKIVHSTYILPFYTGPKILIGLIGGAAFFFCIFAAFSAKKNNELDAWRRPALLVFLSICLIPLCVSALKAVSGVYSPVDTLPYGGHYPHMGIVEQLWTHRQFAGGRSFPAGHASGGFALMALYYLPLSPRKRQMFFLAGFVAGWLMGGYQMARGEHFMSHTLTTMFFALTVITLLARILRISDEYRITG